MKTETSMVYSLQTLASYKVKIQKDGTAMVTLLQNGLGIGLPAASCLLCS